MKLHIDPSLIDRSTGKSPVPAEVAAAAASAGMAESMEAWLIAALKKHAMRLCHGDEAKANALVKDMVSNVNVVVEFA